MEHDVRAEKKERKKKEKRRVIKVRGPRERTLNTTFYQSKHKNELIGSPVFPRKRKKRSMSMFAFCLPISSVKGKQASKTCGDTHARTHTTSCHVVLDKPNANCEINEGPPAHFRAGLGSSILQAC